MFRKFTSVVPISDNIDKAVKTYTEVLGLAPAKRSHVFEKGRYKQHDLMIGDVRLDFIESLDSPEAPGPGGGMARFVRRHGEALYDINVALGVPSLEKYCRGLEAKGIKVFWDVPDNGVVTGGPKAPLGPGGGMEALGIHPLIHPRSTHGVLWEIWGEDHLEPTPAEELARPGNAFKKVKSISVVCRDNDVAYKTYTEGLGLDNYLRSIVYRAAGYKEHVFAVGDIALQLLQPLAGPEASNRGGDMARALRLYGEGLYFVTVDVTDPEKYARGLEAKGVKIDWDPLDQGEVTNGAKKKARRSVATAQPFISAGSAHGVLWKLTRSGAAPLTE